MDVVGALGWVGGGECELVGIARMGEGGDACGSRI